MPGKEYKPCVVLGVTGGIAAYKACELLRLLQKQGIDVYVIIKFGVSINAVAESLKEGVKYRVEKFTGMIVDTVNVNIIGVKL